jgi:hypothetical protein
MLDLFKPTFVVPDLVTIEVLERILVNLLRVFAYARHTLLSYYGNSNFLGSFLYNWSLNERRYRLVEEFNWRHHYFTVKSEGLKVLRDALGIVE